MKERFAPSLSQKIDSYYLLWFKNSKQYVVLDETLYSLIQHFFLANDYKAFEATLLDLNFELNHIKSIYKDVDLFLESCNQIRSEQNLPELKLNKSLRKLTREYTIGNLNFAVYFDSEDLEQLIHPQISHLESDPTISISDHVIDIYKDNESLYLFRDSEPVSKYPRSDYHLLQGKFAMEILCCLHTNNEMDWIGTFHASAVTTNNKAAMIIGDSGFGKSTFTALLLANGFDVIADDITPVKLKDKKVYPYPGGISIKAGAFELMERCFTHFNTLKKHYINPYKGFVKFLDPNHNQKIDFNIGYSCRTMVQISYEEYHKTAIEPLSVHDALGILIPESWLAPDKANAEQFLDWIKDMNFYKLTYSNSEEAVAKFSELLNS